MQKSQGTFIALIAGLVLWGSMTTGCGSVTDSRVAARDAATKATCDRYQGCDAIGPGLTYETYSSCTTTWQGNWEGMWPVSQCQGKVDQAALTSCLNAIGGTVCTSIVDILTTLYVKCAAASVCSAGGPVDAAGG